MWQRFQLVLLLLAILINSQRTDSKDGYDLGTTDKESHCNYNFSNPRNQKNNFHQPEVFFINLDKSYHRRIAMENLLSSMGLLHRRVKGLVLNEDIYIPDDILFTWNQYGAKIQTDETIPNRKELNQRLTASSSSGSITDSQSTSRNKPPFTHVLVGLVGRGKSNALKEVGCTASHLEAMRQAIFENRTDNPYALIVEDDIFIPFSIDFNALAKTAPKGFGILQLFNSNEESMEFTFKHFRNNYRSANFEGNLDDWTQKYMKFLWHENRQKQAISFWSTCAYLINREVMRPVIEKVAYKSFGKSNTATNKEVEEITSSKRKLLTNRGSTNSNSNIVFNHQQQLHEDEWVELRIVAGIIKPCRPKLTACCKPIVNTSSWEFQLGSPCFWAPKGFQADSFIYAMNKTYVLGVPLITNGRGGEVSTFHQDHVISIHDKAFMRQRSIINQFISGQVPLPPFAAIACPTPLPVQSILGNSLNSSTAK